MIRSVLSLHLVWFSAAVSAQEPPPSSTASESEVVSLMDGMDDVLEGVEALETTPEEAAPSGSGRVLTVRQCVAIALEQNPETLVAVEDAEAARQRIGQARSTLFPQLNGEIGWNYNPNADDTFGGSNILTDLIFSGDIGAEKIQRAEQITLTQTIYGGGQIGAAIKAAKHLAESQEWQRQVTLDTVEFNVRQAYYDCILASALVRVAERSVLTFQRHREDAQNMSDVGMVSRFEVLRAQTELGAREADVITAKNAERIAYVNLRRILSIPQDQAITLQGRLEWRPLDDAVGDLIFEAQENRPEMRALIESRMAAEHEQRRATRQYFPTAGAQVQWRNVDGGGPIAPDGITANVGIQLEIFGGLRRKYERAEAKSRVKSLEHQKTNLENLIEFDVRQAYIRVRDAIAKIRSEKGTVALAEEGQRLALLRFQEGIGTQADLLDAELALTNAQSSLVRALRDYAVAIAALDKATGNSPYQVGE